ncbi:MAG: ABC transporter permease [Pseudomonadota bacterium]|nr:ABC transporter permease [Pseudomonadota bacterium]
MKSAGVFAIARKETRELLRDPIYLGLAFAVPMMLLLLFGYGLSLDVKHLPLVFLDEDRTPFSRDYMDSYVHSDYFEALAVVGDEAAARELLQTGEARVIITIPPGFGRHISAGEPVSVAVEVDGSYPTRAEIILGYVEAINGLYSQKLIDRLIATRPELGRLGLPVQADMSIWYNPSLESINAIVPGMVVLIMMMFPAILGALLVVREKESGTIFNLYASPVRRWEILAGKALPYIGVSMLDYLLIYVMSLYLFQVRFVGSFWLLTAAATLYATCTIGLGLLISVLTRTQLAAMLITFLVTITPAFNYSGFITPIASMDETGQFIAHLIPATYFMRITRGSYLKGLNLEQVSFDLAALAIYTLIVYLIAWAMLRKRIG